MAEPIAPWIPQVMMRYWAWVEDRRCPNLPPPRQKKES